MRVRRGDLRDVLVVDNRAAVFVQGRIVVLSEVGTVILAATPEKGHATLDHLTTAVVEVFGHPAPPHDPLELTRVHVADLVKHHVLEETTQGPDV